MTSTLDLISNSPFRNAVTAGLLFDSGVVVHQGVAALVASSTLVADGVVETAGQATFTSTSTLTAAGSIAAGGSATAELEATSTLMAGAEVVVPGAADLSSSSTLTVAGGLLAAAEAMLQSTSTLTAAWSVPTGIVEQYRLPLGLTVFGFGTGSFLLPYAGVGGSQALDFSVVTESPASGLYPPTDGPVDSRSLWIALVSSASQTLTVTPSTAFAVGLEVWDGDPDVDPMALTLVASGTDATLEVAVAELQPLLIRVHPMTNATTGTGSVSWSLVPRAASGILQFSAATSINETPGWLSATVAAATPVGTLEFTLDADPTVIYAATAGVQGEWIGGVLLPQLTVGTHTLYLTDTVSGQTASRTFTVTILVPDPGGPVTPPGPTAPPTAQRWYLEDVGIEHFPFPINPTSMTSPHGTRVVTTDHTLSPTGRAILWEGFGDPVLWTVTGAVETQAFYEALERFHVKQNRVYLTDHLARIWTVAFEGLDFEEKKSSDNDWAYGYTAKFLILDGPVTA